MSATLLVLSPHLDDAALSVGAALAAREGVVVATVFSRVDDPRRAAEDRAALDILGARPVHLGLDDAPLRGIAKTWAALCGTALPPELVRGLAARLDALVDELRPEAVWAPLACGGHVDHRATADAALAWRARRAGPPLSLYEDRPYARARGAVRAAWARLGGEAPACCDDDADDDVHFLRVAGAPPATARPQGPAGDDLGARGAASVVRAAAALWRRVDVDVGARRAVRRRAIDTYATEREALVGPAAAGGWPWDDRCEVLWCRAEGDR